MSCNFYYQERVGWGAVSPLIHIYIYNINSLHHAYYYYYYYYYASVTMLDT